MQAKYFRGPSLPRAVPNASARDMQNTVLNKYSARRPSGTRRPFHPATCSSVYILDLQSRSVGGDLREMEFEPQPISGSS